MVECWVLHLDVDSVTTGDLVIGTLPVNLAAKVCARGAQYWHLSLNLPFEMRGQELDVHAMSGLRATLQCYRINAVDFDRLHFGPV